MSAPRVSICLPTYNGARYLARLLPALRSQRLSDRGPALESGEMELIAIDSSSSDDSAALLREHGARLEVILKESFRHGATRNRIAASARGEILVFLTQDALPIGESFIRELIAGFDDPRTAGITARVLPHPEDDPLTRRTVLAQPEAQTEAHSFDLDGLDGLWVLTETQRTALLAFNDVASAIRASVFAAIPFPDVSFGEDVAWAARALTAGWRLRFAPAAVVHHAHRYTPRQAFARYRIDAHFRRHVLGQTVRPSLISVARGFSYEVREDLRFLARAAPEGRWRAAWQSPFLRGAQVLGQYLGAHGKR
ncbi:MAG TPA: glycosyltransferase [Planctomycetota bacterium]|nr:glycosyltransferase [Planctomycetota bacterium]